jgi:hypothetical protein
VSADTRTLAHAPFTAGAYRPRMGLMPLDPHDWIEIDDRLADDLRLKRRLLAERHDAVFAALPGGELAGREVLDRLVAHLTGRFPEHYALDGRHLVLAPVQERIALDGDDRHPLDLAGRLVQEDLCLMRAQGEGYVLAAGSLCFPSRWLLADKIGRDLAAIHAPVPGYDAHLARPVDRFFAALTRDRPVWRLNWTIHDRADPFQPEAARPADVAVADFATHLFLRVERQTLRRLPCGDVLFTIRTHIRSLGVVAAVREPALRLAAALRGLPEETRAYRGLARIADDLAAWLEARGARV